MATSLHRPNSSGYSRPIEGAEARFVDGNKRTGFVLGILFLELNGYRFSAAEEDAAQAVLQLAGGIMDDAAYTAVVRANSSPEKKIP